MRKHANRPPTRGYSRLDSARPGGHHGHMREDWQRLASWVVSTRDQLGMTTQAALSERSGASLRQVGEVENGRRVGAKTLARIERALGWEPGSARQTLRGGEPTRIDEPSEPVGLRDEAERKIWAIDEIPEEDRWTFIHLRRSKQEQQAAENRQAQ